MRISVRLAALAVAAGHVAVAFAQETDDGGSTVNINGILTFFGVFIGIGVLLVLFRYFIGSRG